ncbi:hypothetical protein GGS21DRAFT_292291 [Xylaria nigripes]|nr:hypothetical protein GGS21DRAFT_292291 [Xylaria nigripes]
MIFPNEALLNNGRENEACGQVYKRSHIALTQKLIYNHQDKRESHYSKHKFPHHSKQEEEEETLIANMSSHTNGPDSGPIYTREMFNNIEAEIARNGDAIKVMTSNGTVHERPNPLPNASLDDPEPGTTKLRIIVWFGNEHILRHFGDGGAPRDYLPVTTGCARIHGPNRTAEQVRELLARVTREFEASEEAAAITRLVKTHLRGRAVDKVIAFGLGSIGYKRGEQLNSFVEHAAVRVVARAAREVSSSPTVRLLVQDPVYTNVCRTVLGEFGVEVVGGFGGKGFALVDDRSVVLAHHPSFPFRAVIADLARPALICMRAQIPANEAASMPLRRLLADNDSARSREMMRGYYSVPLSISRPSAFFDNAWYVRTKDD